MSYINNIMGVTDKVIGSIAGHRSISSAFFKSYKSTPDFFTRAFAVITAPFICTLESLYFALDTVAQIFKCIYYAIKADEANVQDSWAQLKDDVVTFVPVLAAVFLSPLIELVDVIGSGVATLFQNPEIEQESGNKMTCC